MIRKWKEAPQKTRKRLTMVFWGIYTASVLGEFITEKLELREFLVSIFIGSPIAAFVCTFFIAMSFGSLKETLKDHRPDAVKEKPGAGKFKAALPYLFAATFAIAYVVDHLYTRVYTP